jgi:hypothetical protein
MDVNISGYEINPLKTWIKIKSYGTIFFFADLHKTHI